VIDEASVRCSGLTAGYRSRPVIHHINFELSPQGIVGMLGANGAGKTTILRALMGTCKVFGGTISMRGTRIERLSTSARARAGLAYVPQDRKVFQGMTVAENIETVGRLARRKSQGEHADPRDHLKWFPRLQQRYRVVAGSLSGGEQQMLAVALALARNPKVILLDEPSLGLAPNTAEQLMETIGLICQETQLAALLVEQNLRYLRIVTRDVLIVRLGEITARIDANSEISDLTEVF
jgi:branched-chain amino acid transport system ATP-binding protein